MARRDGSVPRRFGFRLPRESSVGQLKELVADAAHLQSKDVTLQCLSHRGAIVVSGRVSL